MNHSSDRRHFLFTTLGTAAYATPLLGMLANACKTTGARHDAWDSESELAGASTTTIRTVRKSATEPNNQENVALYRKAVAAMKATPFSELVDGRQLSWWEAHAEIHNNYCPHGNWFFLPWHRGYLHYFEKVCREFCGDDNFALPFWNWSQDSHFPQAFRRGDEKSNSLYNKTREIGREESLDLKEITHRRINYILNSPDFSVFAGGPSDRTRAIDDSIVDEIWGFSGRLESGPHNRVHATIQGDMGTFASPLDPLFWLHHCNIDRLWAAWVEKKERRNIRTLPIDPPVGSPEERLTTKYWLNARVGGYYDIKREGAVLKAIPAEFRVADLIDPAKLGLGYESIPRSKGPRAGATPATQKNLPIKTKAQNSLGLAETKEPASIHIESSPEIEKVLANSVKPKGDREATLRLVVKKIPFPANTRCELLFFLNAESAKTTDDDPEYIGSMSFFGHNHPGQTVSTAFDLVPTIKNLEAANKKPYGNSQDLIISAIWVRNPNSEDLSGLEVTLDYIELS